MTTEIKVKRYIGLRAMSLIYKALAIVTVLFLIGAIGYITLSAMTSPTGDVYDFNWWLQRALALGLGGGLLAFTFVVLAQVLDVLVSMSDNLRVIARKEETQLAADSGLQSSNLQIAHEIQELKTAIEQQGRLLRLQNPQPQSTQAASQKTIP